MQNETNKDFSVHIPAWTHLLFYQVDFFSIVSTGVWTHASCLQAGTYHSTSAFLKMGVFFEIWSPKYLSRAAFRLPSPCEQRGVQASVTSTWLQVDLLMFTEIFCYVFSILKFKASLHCIGYLVFLTIETTVSNI
jgi:hypothetical protein